MNQEKIGKFIAQCRKNKNITQAELSRKLGISDRAISKWENGKCMPDLSLIQKLCNILDITVNELLSGEKIRQEQLIKVTEKNIINTINYSRKEITKKIKSIIIKLSIIFILFIFSFITYWIIIKYQESPITLKSGEINIEITSYSEKYIAIEITAKDGYSGHLNFEKKNDSDVAYISAYRMRKETKNLNLLNGHTFGLILIEKNVKKLYYDNKLIWNSEMELKKYEGTR